ncbi:hypothetical protein YK48G_03850 [Lentilactobacillus fungorum]|uniref:Uncharacterized protein n=1 Tax=Lentilactobacillus fungorum TaxID=2201250 RepID=A0ABQ3VWQ4_9LACO|nr:hypothetical protein [Lentilactobacillus fungorum]GHP12960.1 hypothetical protein YK48G_03850 [Lentilactobacillus fungorum]
MIAFGLDSTRDLDFDPNAGVFNMVTDDDEISQKLSSLLNINIAELPWNEDIGLNHNELLASGDDKGVIQAILSDYLEDQWPDLFDSVEITNFSVDYQQRITALEATVTLTTGQTITTDVNSDEGDGENATNE